MRTGRRHVYAIGDIVPGFALAHVASHEAVVAVEHLAGHDPEPVRMDLMPRVTFCRPQIASVGLTEEEAKAAGREVKAGSFPFRALGKATIVGEIDGFAKFVADAEGRACCSAPTSSAPTPATCWRSRRWRAGRGNRRRDRDERARPSHP